MLCIEIYPCSGIDIRVVQVSDPATSHILRLIGVQTVCCDSPAGNASQITINNLGRHHPVVFKVGK